MGSNFEAIRVGWAWVSEIQIGVVEHDVGRPNLPEDGARILRRSGPRTVITAHTSR